MPCFTVSKIRVSKEIKSFDAMKKALKNLGFSFREIDQAIYCAGLVIQKDGITCSQYEQNFVDQVMTEYCSQVIKDIAAEFNLFVEQGPTQYEFNLVSY